MTVRIAHLIEAPGAAQALAQWFANEWAPWYGPDGDGDAAVDLAACADTARLPLCLVALDEDGTVIGTASLRTESVGSELGVGPWLAALLVRRDRRGEGIGGALVNGVVDEARRLGFDAIYSSMASVEETPGGLAWERIGAARSLRGDVSVFRLDLEG
ncbi:MAG: GNAT family N-acetyltransferase [Alphaproteobacteria bacterium]